MQKLTRSPQGTVRLLTADKTPVRLVNAARNVFLTVVARALVTVTVAAATSVRNRGSAFALADSLILDENGTERSVVGGKVLRFASEMSAPSALTATRLSAFALPNGTLPVGVYQLEEAARFNFAHPLSLDPLETAFIERDARQSLQLYIRRVVDAVAALVVAGPATVTVTNIDFTVIQGYETPGPRGVRAPLFIPTIREQTLQVNGAAAALPLYLLTTNPIRQIVLTQEVNGNEVGDIVSAVRLRGDYRDIIGTAPMDTDDILLDSEFDFGGAVVSSNRAHMGWNFQRYGQLSEVLNPAQDANPRFELVVAQSATAGQSMVRATIFELTRTPYTAPDIPFPI